MRAIIWLIYRHYEHLIIGDRMIAGGGWRQQRQVGWRSGICAGVGGRVGVTCH